MNLKNKTKNLMKKTLDSCELENQWLLDLCFLADITRKLYEHNIKLQGADKLIIDCYKDILYKHLSHNFNYKNQLKSKTAVYFSQLNNFKCDSKDIFEYADQIVQLLQAFQQRFALLHKFNTFKIFVCPFDSVMKRCQRICTLSKQVQSWNTWFVKVTNFNFTASILMKKRFPIWSKWQWALEQLWTQQMYVNLSFLS